MSITSIRDRFANNELLIKMLLSSVGITAVAFIMQLLSSRFLPVEVFVAVTLIVYKVGLLSSASGLANDFYVMRVNSADANKPIRVNAFSLIFLVITFGGVSAFFDSEILPVMVLALLGTVMVLYSAKLRLIGDALVSSASERLIPISLSLIFAILLFLQVINVTLDWLTPIILICGIFLMVSLFLFSLISKKINPKLVFVMDKSFIKHQMLIYVSLLFFVSFTYLDKVIAESYLDTTDLAYYLVVFQIFAVFKILGQVLYKYLFVKIKDDAPEMTGYMNVRLVLQFIIIALFSIGLFYYSFSTFYFDRFVILFVDVAVMVVASLIYIAYQPIAAKINSTMGERAMVFVNLSNFLSLGVVLPLFYLGLSSNNITWLLYAFLSFWLFKFFAGLVITRMWGVRS